MKKTISFLICSILAFCYLMGENVTTVQPKIMVIPYTKEGEDLRTVLEQDANKRIVLTKIKEAFDNRGFSSVDFTAKLKAVSQNSAFTSGNQTDIKSLVIENSGADIYVEAEILVGLSASGNSVRIIMTAYDASTGSSLSNKVGESGKFYTDDIGKLASKAVEQCATEFLNVMQTKFTDIVENGRSIIINFGFDANSPYSMSSEVGTQGLQLSDELELWMEQNAYRNNYHIQGTTDKQMIFDDVRIPLKDPKNGSNYNINRFSLEVFKFMKQLGLQVQRDIKGNTLYITIN
ncbi:MAG: DUF6175 family protein [Paraprevotella sp.]|nr:DUF6175 family protein [Paraprevotella sp.]